MSINCINTIITALFRIRFRGYASFSNFARKTRVFKIRRIDYFARIIRNEKPFSESIATAERKSFLFCPVQRCKVIAIGLRGANGFAISQPHSSITRNLRAASKEAAKWIKGEFLRHLLRLELSFFLFLSSSLSLLLSSFATPAAASCRSYLFLSRHEVLRCNRASSEVTDERR